MKLIRHKIPLIVAKTEGKALRTSKADPKLLPTLLEAKLLEELAEYMTEPRQPKELVDVLEVIYSLARLHNVSEDTLNRWRVEKFTERGGFMEGVVLDPDP